MYTISSFKMIMYYTARVYWIWQCACLYYSDPFLYPFLLAHLSFQSEDVLLPFSGVVLKVKKISSTFVFLEALYTKFQKESFVSRFLLILFSVNTGQIQVGMDPWADRVSFKTLTTDSGKVEWLQLYSYSLRWQGYCHVHVNLTEDMEKLLPGHSEGFYESSIAPKL